MPRYAPPVPGAKIISRQGCRHLANRTPREHDLMLCDQSGRPMVWHNGIDIGDRRDEFRDVGAVLDGTIRGIWDDGRWRGYGRCVLVEHTPDVFSFYAHLFAIPPDEWIGRAVRQGEDIGAVGRTGGHRDEAGNLVEHPLTVPHLHFELVRRWPLEHFDVGNRYDILSTLANVGIIPEDDRLVFADHPVLVSDPGGPIAEPETAPELVERPAGLPAPVAGTPPAGTDAGPIILAAIAAAALRRRRGS